MVTKKSNKIKVETNTGVEVGTETKEVESKAAPKKEKRVFHPSDLIPCKNAFAGTAIMIGKKTGIKYTWQGLGDVEDVEYQDVMAEILKRTSTYIYKPLIIIEDEELLSQRPDLKQFYSKIYPPEDIEDIIRTKSVPEMLSMINGLPVGCRDSVKNIVATMIQEGTLDSVKKIKAIDEYFGTKMMMQTELFSEK